MGQKNYHLDQVASAKPPPPALCPCPSPATLLPQPYLTCVPQPLAPLNAHFCFWMNNL